MVCIFPCSLGIEVMDGKDDDFKQRFKDCCPRRVFSIDPTTQRVCVFLFFTRSEWVIAR